MSAPTDVILNFDILSHEKLRKEFRETHKSEINFDKGDDQVYQKVFDIINGMIDKRLDWHPLHYVCQFMPEDVETVKLFIDHDQDSAFKKDQFGRQPLHIACDSGASKDTILKLLEANARKSTIRQRTTYLGRLPIHIACNRKATLAVIYLLLKSSLTLETNTHFS